MGHAKLILAFLGMMLVVGTIYADDPPKVGYLEHWGVPTEKQEALLQNGAWLVVDTVNNVITVEGKGVGPCPDWCPCGPDQKCWNWGNTCHDCAAAPSPGMKQFINDIVDTLIARNGIVVLPKENK